MYEALSDAKEDNEIGVVLISGEGPSSKEWEMGILFWR